MYAIAEKHRPVLALNAAFLPSGWITPEMAAKHYAEDQVLCGLGQHKFVFNGGTGRNGARSKIEVSSIIAITGKVVPFDDRVRFKLPKQGNRMLFMRDRYICAYCGDSFQAQKLTREHVKPRNGGHAGSDTWGNVVTACEPCNSKKGCRTPEAAKMPLLYLPYAPSPYEHMIMLGRNVLADQMEFLMASVPKSSRLLS